MREDTITQKVYVFDQSYNHDTLLYNFNLSLGDTLPLSYLHQHQMDTIYVTMIDSFFDGTVYRKQFHLHSLDPSLTFPWHNDNFLEKLYYFLFRFS